MHLFGNYGVYFCIQQIVIYYENLYRVEILRYILDTTSLTENYDLRSDLSNAVIWLVVYL